MGMGEDPRHLPQCPASPPPQHPSFSHSVGSSYVLDAEQRQDTKAIHQNICKSQTFFPLLFGAESSSDEKCLSCHGKMLIRMLKRKARFESVDGAYHFKPIKNKQNKAILCRHSHEKTGRKYTDMLIIFIPGSRVMSDFHYCHDCFVLSVSNLTVPRHADVIFTYNFPLKSTGPGPPGEAFAPCLPVTCHQLQTASSRVALCCWATLRMLTARRPCWPYSLSFLEGIWAHLYQSQCLRTQILHTSLTTHAMEPP